MIGIDASDAVPCSAKTGLGVEEVLEAVVARLPPPRGEEDRPLKALLVEETTGRARSMLAARRKAAGFPTGKTFTTWDPGASSIPAPTQQSLRTLEWLSRRENLVVCGPSGTGKTFFLEALGQQAVEEGKRVAWFTLEDLGAMIRAHRPDDTITKAVARILRADLIVIDDIGLLPVADDAAEPFPVFFGQKALQARHVGRQALDELEQLRRQDGQRQQEKQHHQQQQKEGWQHHEGREYLTYEEDDDQRGYYREERDRTSEDESILEVDPPPPPQQRRNKTPNPGSVSVARMTHGRGATPGPSRGSYR